MKAFKITSIILIFLLVALRLLLPYALLSYATYRINKIPDYQVSIADLDVHLLQGSYVIKDIKLEKISKKIAVPFFSAKSIELAVDWPSLLHGLFAAEISINQPTVNFVTDPKGKNEQLTIHQEWQNAVKALFPLNFNKIYIHDGSLHFRSFTSQPPFDLYLKNIQASVDNLHNKKALRQQELPSSLIVNADTMNNDKANLEMNFNPFADQPTFKLNAKLEKLNVRETNNFLRSYTKMHVVSGQFSLYVEAAAAKGRITGYAKPIFKYLEVAEPSAKNPVEAVYKGAVKFASKVLKNPKTQTIATKINISGDIENPDTSIWSIIFNFLRHAFLQAFLPQIDHDISLEQAKY